MLDTLITVVEIQINKTSSFCSQWTLADFYFLHASEYLKGINPQTLDEFPGLNGLFNRLVENPKIAEWREKRPLTQY